jgi:hypothetical protein
MGWNLPRGPSYLASRFIAFSCPLSCLLHEVAGYDEPILANYLEELENSFFLYGASLRLLPFLWSMPNGQAYPME